MTETSAVLLVLYNTDLDYLINQNPNKENNKDINFVDFSFN